MIISRVDGLHNDRWIKSVKFSNVGLVRRENEDHLFAGHLSGVYCVADGMGGGEEGAKASEMVCAEVYRAVSNATGGFFAKMQAVDDGLQAANSVVYNYAKSRSYRQMGSTAAIIVFDSPGSGHAAICHVGDSRVYRIRDGLATPLTRDHTVAVEYKALIFKNGNQEPINGRNHPLAHVLTRAIGTDSKVVAEWTKIDIVSGDRFLVCSDGVHDVLSDALIGFLASYDSLETVRERLSSAIVNGGAPDNYSFILLEVGHQK